MNARVAATYAAVLGVAAFGLFTNLGERRLWGDEAETAVLAINVTQFGVPRVDDGRNALVNLPERGDSNEAGLWTWSPWLDEYVAASAIAALGPTTVAARLPFAVLGLASVVLLAQLAWRATRRHEVALLATALYATSVPFLLHARQARYYAIVALAELWLVHGVGRALEDDPRRRSAGAVHIALALAALFYCNYIFVPGNLVAVAAVAAWAWRRQGRPPTHIAWSLAGFAALAVPWLVYAPPQGQLAQLGLRHATDSILYYLLEIHHHFTPWIVLAIPICVAIARRLNRATPPPPGPTDATRSPAAFEKAFETFAWLAIAASLGVYAATPLRFFRYLIPLAPLLAFLVALLLVRHVHRAWLRRGIFALLVTSNALSIATLPRLPGVPRGTEHAFALPYWVFARSIATPHRERLDDVLEFLSSEAGEGDAVYVADPEFPLIFYTDLRIVDARYHRLPAALPDWIFETSPSGIAARRPLRVPAATRALYSRVALPVTASKRGGNRPDPHEYEPFETEKRETLHIHRLRGPGTP